MKPTLHQQRSLLFVSAEHRLPPLSSCFCLETTRRIAYRALRQPLALLPRLEPGADHLWDVGAVPFEVQSQSQNPKAILYHVRVDTSCLSELFLFEGHAVRLTCCFALPTSTFVTGRPRFVAACHAITLLS
ncbi:uncharacterized protein M421DRAFT_311579 [Didymella exigua CBS 183.55]|uniref:Uncharacterized protein n=1 Tax=Didymella exigua CBS 183.55 TaxID=1150837 RepID=A0A6A5R7B3_9PLEO|nr:uncharacterized protein M421DRAFT_311579 [Didymella exigua CBS 183.55]KAF1923513.1 hypothetical protein M421DRAFT_311579 [Didymella exigua CBS 183.55]